MREKLCYILSLIRLFLRNIVFLTKLKHKNGIFLDKKLEFLIRICYMFFIRLYILNY